MNPNDDMVIDHINRHTFDNRIDNLRIVTNQENSRNRTKQHNNMSGIAGVSKRKINGNDYWRVTIINNSNDQIEKTFSIKRFGDEQAKQLAIEQRQIWKDQYGYIGE